MVLKEEETQIINIRNRKENISLPISKYKIKQYY